MDESVQPTPAAPGEAADFASGAKILSIGIASTGIFTFAYLVGGSRLLDRANYSRLSICWAVMYVILCVIYRPIEQLLSRTIADRQARGASGHILRTPAIIQASFAGLFLIVAFALRQQITSSLFKGSTLLFWILVTGVTAYAASYFARGWLAGHKRFALYGALVFLESTSRFMFPVAVAIGIGSGLGVIAWGMAAAPFASLCVIPFALGRVRTRVGREVEVADAAREGPAHRAIEEAATDLSLRHGGGFAAAVVTIMASEQTLMNAGVLIVALSAGGGTISSGLAGFVFNVLLIVRAPLQLFQAIQTAILPHLAGMEARDSSDEFRRAIRQTLIVIAGFAALVALGLLAIGPFVMRTVLGAHGYSYDRYGLALVGVGMGLHLCSGALNQALLARSRHAAAARAWFVSAAVFVAFVALRAVHGQVWSVEVGYFISTALLAAMLWVLYSRTRPIRPPGKGTNTPLAD
jgi:O-antigen/teichoic acid export membrane protein